MRNLDYYFFYVGSPKEDIFFDLNFEYKLHWLVVVVGYYLMSSLMEQFNEVAFVFNGTIAYIHT